MDERKFPSEFAEKTVPVSDDWLFLADNADSNKIKKIKYSNVQGKDIVWRGAYDNGTAYVANDAVYYTDGKSYICKLATTGNIPTNTTYWDKMTDVALSTQSIAGAVELATDAEVSSWTNTSWSNPLVVQPSQLKTTNDNIAAEVIKIKSKVDVRLASTANIASISGLLTIDGVTTVAGDRVLLKDQSTASQNGIYIVSASTWTRATDFDSATNNEVVLGAEVWVSAGSTNIGKCYTLTTTGTITVWSTNLTFTQTYPIGTSDISARVKKTTTQTINSGTRTTVTWDSEDYDTSSIHDNVTNNSRLTIPTGQGGKYLITANIVSTNIYAYSATILRNGSTVIAQNWHAVSSSTPTGNTTGATPSAIFNLSAGDYVEVQVYSTSWSCIVDTTVSSFLLQKIA